MLDEALFFSLVLASRFQTGKWFDVMSESEDYASETGVNSFEKSEDPKKDGEWFKLKPCYPGAIIRILFLIIKDCLILL